MDVGTWARSEFGTVDLGDVRRTRRAVQMAEAMAKAPCGSIPEQNGRWCATIAAYTLLDAEESTLGSLTAPHRAETLRKAKEAGGPVLFVHDDTTLDLTTHEAMEGRGTIGDGNGMGFLVHDCLAVRPDRTILGLADVVAWTRSAERTTKRRQVLNKTWRPDPNAPPEETRAERLARRTEARVWEECLERIGRVPEGAVWVSVADRGSDVFSHFAKAVALGWQVVSRIVHDRVVESGGGGRLIAEARALPPMATKTISVREGGVRSEATASMSWMPATIRSPRNRKDKHPPISAWVVRVWVPGTSVEWLLLSTLPVESEAEAAERAEWYGLRWIVEEFHKGLKTGCGVERRQLRTAARFLAFLGFCCVLAVRMLELRREGRDDPDAPCGESPETIRLLAAAIGGSPDKLATRRQFWHGVARLGGFLGRKSDGDPGWQTLWKGYSKFLAMQAAITLHAGMTRCL